MCCCALMKQSLTEQYLSGRRGRFTVSTPVLTRPFLVMKCSTRSISCTQRTRTNPRTMMFRAHFWEVSTSFREIGIRIIGSFHLILRRTESFKHVTVGRCRTRTVQFLFQEARIRFRKAKYMVGSRENSGNS